MGENMNILILNKNENLKTVYDTTTIAILPYDSFAWHYKGAKQAELLIEEIKIIDSLFTKSIIEYNLKRKELFEKNGETDSILKINLFIDLKRFKYYRQYMPVVNKQGEKIVYINCFCKNLNTKMESTYWRKELVQCSDGGSCFFELYINLSSKSYFDFRVNGLG